MLLPLGPLVEARAPRAERALLVAVIERQQGVGAQTLLKRQNNYLGLIYSTKGPSEEFRQMWQRQKKQPRKIVVRLN